MLSLIIYALSLFMFGLAFFIPSPLNIPFTVFGTLMLWLFFEAIEAVVKEQREQINA